MPASQKSCCCGAMWQSSLILSLHAALSRFETCLKYLSRCVRDFVSQCAGRQVQPPFIHLFYLSTSLLPAQCFISLSSICNRSWRKSWNVRKKKDLKGGREGFTFPVKFLKSLNNRNTLAVHGRLSSSIAGKLNFPVTQKGSSRFDLSVVKRLFL